jgi:hypothetical protein
LRASSYIVLTTALTIGIAHLDPRDRLLDDLAGRHFLAPDQVGQREGVVALELAEHAHARASVNRR